MKTSKEIASPELYHKYAMILFAFMLSNLVFKNPCCKSFFSINSPDFCRLFMSSWMGLQIMLNLRMFVGQSLGLSHISCSQWINLFLNLSNRYSIVGLKFQE